MITGPFFLAFSFPLGLSNAFIVTLQISPLPGHTLTLGSEKEHINNKSIKRKAKKKK